MPFASAMRIFCLIAVALGFMPACAFGGPAVENLTGCERDISQARLRRVRLPSFTKAVDFALTPDDQKAVVLTIASEQQLWQEVGGWKLAEWSPGQNHRSLSDHDAQQVISQWRKQAQDDPGLKLKEYSPISWHATQKVYYAYDLRSGKWTKVGWEEGAGLLPENYEESSWGPHAKEVSPDGRKILRTTLLREKDVYFLFMLTDGTARKYRLSLACAEGGIEKDFNMKWGELGRWKVQWTSDSAAAVILDTGNRHSNKFMILRLK
ncbi:MAG: hypothetical protein Q8Q08_06825 [Candidatus Omnitrophota bacterium]|nr:hypothetical protein [Candidatus Omnitrophota bacterium]